MFFLETIQNHPKIPGTTASLNFYLFRGVDATIMQNEEEALIYIKIPGFIILSSVTEVPFSEELNSTIEESGQFEVEHPTMSENLMYYVINRAKEQLMKFATLSQNQLKRISDDYNKNEEKIENSFLTKMDDFIIPKKNGV